MAADRVRFYSHFKFCSEAVNLSACRIAGQGKVLYH